MKSLLVILIFLSLTFFGLTALQRIATPPSQTSTSTSSPTSQTQMPEQSNPKLTASLDDFKVNIFTRDLGNARDLEFSPQGTLMVSIPEKGTILALPDTNNDGQADQQVAVITGLKRPHGIAFFNNQLFIAEETQVVRYHWNETDLKATQDKILFALPKGSLHWTRSLVFNKAGQLFVSLGSSCNVCNEEDERLAAIIVSDAEGTTPRLYAKGLRNAVFMTIHPETQNIWTTEMGRDHLGDTTPPDEINIITDGQDYGWPECYSNKKEDAEFKDKKPVIETVENPFCYDTASPIFEIPAHSAPLGLTFINSPLFPSEWQGDLLVAYHGSWNSSEKVGYKVVRLDVEGNTIKSEHDFLTGFLEGNTVRGRPVDLIFDKTGSLYISDDKTGIVYRISK